MLSMLFCSTHLKKVLKNVVYVYVCVRERLCGVDECRMCGDVYKGQKRQSDSLQLELQMVVSHLR